MRNPSRLEHSIRNAGSRANDSILARMPNVLL